MQDLAGRLKHRIQLTTDGHKAYLEAVEGAFGSEIDYAMLVKDAYPLDATHDLCTASAQRRRTSCA